jgi:hypothetical protein
MAARRRGSTSTNKSEESRQIKAEVRDFLERTRAFFTRRSNMPCLGAARFKHAQVRRDSSPPSRALLCFGRPPLWRQRSPPLARGLSLRPPLWSGLDHGPRL